MKAIILAAGFGTRLKPLTNALPKPMFPVLNRPILEHALHFLSSQGIKEIAINLHHQSERITDYFGNGKNFKVKLHFSKEENILGTAGGIKKLELFFKYDKEFIYNNIADVYLISTGYFSLLKIL